MTAAGRLPPGRAKGIACALGAAVLFGFATPCTRPVLERVDPAASAGYLYLGQAILLSFVLAASRKTGRGAALTRREAALTRRDLPALALGVLAGGLIAPGAYTAGLALISSYKASLLLGLEIVFTLLIAVGVRHERISARAWAGIALLVGGGLMVALPASDARAAGETLTSAAAQGGSSGAAGSAEIAGALFIVLACAGWAIDSNATATIAAKDATVITLVKGWAAAAGYLVLCLAAGRSIAASPADLAALLGVGALGYGLSLRLFVVALRHLGAAMTTGIFAAAPIVGFLASIAVFRERPGPAGWMALGAAAAGVLLLASARHAHEHIHDEETHAHPHIHDEHHDHEHAPGTEPIDGHSHEHRHGRLVHSHAHDADLHHTHRH